MKPLNNITVVEAASFYPAPFCTRLLSIMGAKVVKVEPPSGDPARMLDVVFAAFNIGKEIVRIDLKTAEGREEFFEIVKDADVVVEGYRPGVARRLGIDYDSVRKVKKDIIYCSISAFGQESKLKAVPAHDVNILGLAGILEMSGIDEPRDPNVQLADFSSALYSAFLILSAIIERERSGKGCYIDVSMFHSALFSVPIHSSSILNGLGILPAFSSNPVYGVYRTSDGYVTLGIVAEEHFWRRLCQVLDLNYDFSLVEAFNRYDEVRKAIEEKLRNMKTDEVVDLLTSANIPAMRVFSLKEYEKIEEVVGDSLIEEVEWEGRKIKLVKPPFRW